MTTEYPLVFLILHGVKWGLELFSADIGLEAGYHLDRSGLDRFPSPGKVT